MHDVMKASGIQLAHDLDGRLPGPTAKRHRHAHHGLHPLRLKQGQMPRNRRAPVMPHHAHLLLIQLIHGRLNISADGQYVVFRRITRRTALAVATHFRDQHAVTGRSQWGNLLPPGMPAFGKAMQQPNGSPTLGAGTVQAQVNPVDLQNLMFELIHIRLH